MAYSRAEVTNSLMEKLSARCRIEPKPTNTERSVADLMERLNLIKN
jgi:ATP-dependent Clp protease protease subunit